MKNIIYYHTEPQSLQSKIIQGFMGLIKMSKIIEKKIINNSFPKEAARIPKSIQKENNVRIIHQSNRKIWELTGKNTSSDLIILYLHGGGYFANITIQHWQLVEQLLKNTNAKIFIPDYPLAPDSNCLDVYEFTENLYSKIISNNPNKRTAFIGDSAGCGLALGFAQTIKNKAIKQPEEIILLSPWLDASMIHPELEVHEKNDKILTIKGLKHAGEDYAGNIAIKDPHVSPLYGSFNGLGKISVFTGTNDLLISDARRCKELLETQGSNFNYFEYPHMFHDWILIKGLKEAKSAIEKVSHILNKSGSNKDLQTI